MAVNFKIPKSPQKSIETINEFKGVDFTNSPANCDINKSPNAVNMIRDVPGKVRKRMGFKTNKWYGTNILNNSASTTGIFTVNADKSVSINGSSGTLTLGSALMDTGTYVLKGIEKSGNTEDYGIYVYNGATLIGSITNLGTEAIEVSSFVNATVVLKVFNATNVTVYPAIYDENRVSGEYVPFLGGGPKTINGYHTRKGDPSPLYHVGEWLIKDNVIIYSGANDAISHSWEFDDYLYILDGKKMLVYDGTTVSVVENGTDTYIPTLTIAKIPATGGGQEYEPINLLCSAFKEEFQGDGTTTDYQMSLEGLDATTVKAWIKDANGDWNEYTEDVHFSVDRVNGIVRWDSPPPTPDLTGEDNVRIQAYRTDPDYAPQINKCTFGTRFGVNGAFDRLFVSGNPDYPNADWYSDQWDPSYFPDLSYSRLGSSKSAIVGYSIISNYLAAHKDEMERDLSIVLREGDLVDDKPSFKIINTLQGAGAIAQNSFAYLCTEPIFLTRSGLYAVTAQDITGEKYAQSRSFYLNGKLTQEDMDVLRDAYACIYKDMYLLSVAEDRLYILDGIQPMRTDKSEPYATRQYAGFYCDRIPAKIMWEENNKLFFGTRNGRICEFHTDKESLASYGDQGSGEWYNTIECKWETPDIDGQLFYKNKTLRYVAVRIGAAIATSVDIYGMDKGLWRLLRRDTSTGRYLVFSVLQFSKFSFSSDTTQKVSHTKVKIKKVDKYRIRLENNELNEPFSIYDIGLEYVENGNYKG